MPEIHGLGYLWTQRSKNKEPLSLLQQIWTLIKKDALIEWRQKYALGGMLLYVVATVYVVYVATIEVEAVIWNALFWIIILFASVNAVAKSFVGETGRRELYYYSIVSPLAVILSKMIYNIGLLLVLTILNYAVFSLVSGNPVEDHLSFWMALFLGGLGFSITFTFISAIAAQARNSATLMAILSFPVIIPILLSLIQFSGGAMGVFPVDEESVGKSVLTLLAIDGILIALAVVLFPFVWRD